MSVAVYDDTVVSHPSEPLSCSAAGSETTLPYWRLLGLAGSASFAIWTSLTCFVC